MGRSSSDKRKLNEIQQFIQTVENVNVKDSKNGVVYHYFKGELVGSSPLDEFEKHSGSFDIHRFLQQNKSNS